MRLLFLHGWGGKRTHYWMPWLEAELTALGHRVHFPKIPNSFNPDKARWLGHIGRFVEEFAPDAVVGHSIGATAWWHYQAQSPYPLHAQLFVAPPTFASFGKIASFFPLPEGFHARDARVIAAKDDPNIDPDALRGLCESQGMSLELLPSGGHLDPKSECDRLPQALDYLRLKLQ